MPSETSQVRDVVLPYLKGYGVDLGYGGDAISRTSINIDLHRPYANVGGDCQHLAGDCRVLHWFADNALDYVYSSHLLEDFEDLDRAIAEWLRVIRPGGVLALCLPDEQKYRTYSKARGEAPNEHHSHALLNAGMILDIIGDRAATVLNQDSEPYSFILILEKR